MKTTTKAKGNGGGATKLDIAQLVVLTAYAKTFKSGKQGFFGKVMNPATGDRYQIVGAVKID